MSYVGFRDGSAEYPSAKIAKFFEMVRGFADFFYRYILIFGCGVSCFQNFFANFATKQ